MEMTERRLRRMGQEVDDMHRTGTMAIARDIAGRHAGQGAPLTGSSRRRFVRDAGLGSLALAIGTAVLPVGHLISPAYGQAADTDQSLAAFAQGVELAAAQVYQRAIQSGKVRTPAAVTAANTFAGHHQQHAEAFAAIVGSGAAGKANPGLLRVLSDQIDAAADEDAALTIVYQLENGAAATYLVAIGSFAGKQALALAASIMPVEAQHATALGHALNLDPTATLDYLPPFQAPDEAIKSTAFPPAS